MRGGDYIGFIHAGVGSLCNAYRRRSDRLDDHLGRFPQEEAVRRVMRACGRASERAAA
jgi:hypothetical protein